MMPNTAQSALILCCALVIPTAGRSDESDPPSNLRVLQKLAAEVGSAVRQETALEGIRVGALRVLPTEIGWAFERDLSEALGIAEAREDSLGASVEVGITDATVVYEEIRREGLFGSKVLDRVVTLSARVKVEREGMNSTHSEYVKLARDTVRLAEIENLESPILPMTKGVLPNPGFFDDLIEPLIVLGAMGVAVYLLFAVRS